MVYANSSNDNLAVVPDIGHLNFPMSYSLPTAPAFQAPHVHRSRSM